MYILFQTAYRMGTIFVEYSSQQFIHDMNSRR